MELRHIINLVEGRDAPLYHMAHLEKAMCVFEEDLLDASWNHDLSHLGLGDQVAGTSLTRNPRYWYPSTRWARFTFDQTRLSQRHRIVPLDGDRAFGGPEYTARTSNSAPYGDTLDEEFVIGLVRNAHRYIVHVLANLPSGDSDFDPEEAVNMREAAIAWSRKFGVPLEITPALAAL